MNQLLATTLENSIVRLELLSLDHVPALLKAATNSRMHYDLTFVPESLEAMRTYVQTALDQQQKNNAIPFAIVNVHTFQVVGSTRFMNLEFWPWNATTTIARHNEMPDVIEIGSTWISGNMQRTAMNSNTKLLMLEHAFTTFKVRCVRFKTDARNTRSRNAILRLGANFDGILRAHMPASDRSIRDSAYYSILESEWDSVKTRLEQRLLLHK